MTAWLATRGWTQAELSRRSGIRPGWISQLMLLRADWLPHHIDAVARALGVTPRDLMPGPDDETSAEVRANPAEPALTSAELLLLEAVREGDALRLVSALNAALVAARTRPPAGQPASQPLKGPPAVLDLTDGEPELPETLRPANSNHAPGATRAKLDRLFDPPRLGGPTKRKDPP